MATNLTKHVCQMCGKTFYGRSNATMCSEECRARYRREYNTRYVTERRKTDPAFKRLNQVRSAASSRKGYGKLAWEKKVWHAETILKLAEMDNARNLVAAYIDQNFIARANGIKSRAGLTEEQREAFDALAEISSN